MSIVIQLKPQWNKIHLCLEYLRNVFMLLNKGFSKGGLSFWKKSFKSQWWLVSLPLLRISRFSSLRSQCLLLDKNPFKFLSTCPSFYLPAADMYVYFPEWLHSLLPANGFFAATGGSRDWLQRLSFWVYNASFRLRAMLKKIISVYS